MTSKSSQASAESACTIRVPIMRNVRLMAIGPGLAGLLYRDLVTDLNRATAGKAMTLPATDGDEGEPA